MSSSKPPFRAYLKPTRRGKAGVKVYRDLMRVQAGEHLRDYNFLRYIATEADEIVAWTLINKEATLFTERRWFYGRPEAEREWANTAAALLTERAEREMAAENIFWSPLTDVLFVVDAWSKANVYEMASQLRYWVQSVNSSSNLNELLAFNADVPLVAVAENARVLTWAQVDRITDRAAGVESLARNPEALIPHARRLMAKGWSIWQRPLPGERSSPEMQLRLKWLSMFEALVKSGESLPTELRTALIADAEQPISDKWNSPRTELTRMATIAAVAADPALTNDELARLLALRPTGPAVRPKNAYASMGLVRTIAKHPNANDRIWLRILDSRLSTWTLDMLSELPACVASAPVRARMLEMAEDGVIVQRLLSHCASSAEWRNAFLRLTELSPTLAAQELSAGRIPAGVSLDPTDLRALLASDVREVRLVAICALSTSVSTSVPVPAEAQELPLRR